MLNMLYDTYKYCNSKYVKIKLDMHGFNNSKLLII